MARETVLEGVFAINKPKGMSSAQVIRDCQTHFNPSALFRPLLQQEAEARARESNSQRRRRSKAKRDMRVKMGHGGTLDPLATGVLILGVGRGTKELPRFLECTKTYETVVLFGASTDTYDRAGRVLRRRPYDDVSRVAVEQALAHFRGTHRQLPPLYSALKMNGKPLYEYAREGLSLPREIETREIHVKDLTLVEWYEPGTHSHRWPVEEAGLAEQSLAERVWRMGREQATGSAKKRSAEEEKSDMDALAAHEAFKRRAEEKQDALVYDRPQTKRRRGGSGAVSLGGGRSGSSSDSHAVNNGHRATAKRRGDDQLLMSGALGELPSSPYNSGNDGSSKKDEKGGDTDGDVNNDGKGATRAKRPTGRGSNLLPATPGPDAPPPWEGKGPPAAKIRLTVSSGFYVRSFCHDLGEKVGSAAMMAELARTRQSDFCVGTDTVLEYDDLAEGEAVWAPKVERLLQQWADGSIGASTKDGAAIKTVETMEASVAATDAANGKDEPDGKSEAAESEWNGIDDNENGVLLIGEEEAQLPKANSKL